MASKGLDRPTGGVGQRPDRGDDEERREDEDEGDLGAAKGHRHKLAPACGRRPQEVGGAAEREATAITGKEEAMAVVRVQGAGW
jgi:hypothetical protein